MKKFIILAAIISLMSQNAFADDPDGYSRLDGTFIALSSIANNGNIVYQSFEITESTKNIFSKLCAESKIIWIDNTPRRCLSANMHSEYSPLEIEVDSKTTDTGSDYYPIVSNYPSPPLHMRDLTQKEKIAITDNCKSNSTRCLKQSKVFHPVKWKAVDGKNFTAYFVSCREDTHGNLLTHYFFMSKNIIKYTGNLPDWPKKATILTANSVPSVIIARGGDASSMEVYSLSPKIHLVMSVGVGS